MEKETSQERVFLLWQYQRAKKAYEKYEQRIADLKGFIELAEAELKKQESGGNAWIWLLQHGLYAGNERLPRRLFWSCRCRSPVWDKGKRKKEQAEREWKEAERQNRIEEKAADLPDWKEEFRNAGIPAKRMLLSSLICGIQVKEEEIRICFKVCQGSAIHGTDGFGVPEPGL